MEATLAELKNPQTIASTTAIAISLSSIIYFQKKLNDIIQDQTEMKAHLSSLISTIDPNTKNQIEQLKIALRELDGKILLQDERIRELGGETEVVRKQPENKRYVRYTPKNNVSEKGFVGIRLKENQISENRAQGVQGAQAVDDLEADLHAMQD